MRAVPPNVRTKRVPFGTTRWNVIVSCARRGGISSEEEREALAFLCGQYWPPLYAFARNRGHRPPEAQDLTQAFFAYLLESRMYDRADPAKGRFRSFLLTVFKRFLSDAVKRETSQKRGGGQELVVLSSELTAAERRCQNELAHGAPLDEERFFERQWAETLVRKALASLGAEYAGEARAQLFEELRGFLIAGDGMPTQEETAQRLQMPAATVRSHVARLRARYRETLRAEVAGTVDREEDIDDELRYLCQVLLRG